MKDSESRAMPDSKKACVFTSLLARPQLDLARIPFVPGILCPKRGHERQLSLAPRIARAVHASIQAEELVEVVVGAHRSRESVWSRVSVAASSAAESRAVFGGAV